VVEWAFQIVGGGDYVLYQTAFGQGRPQELYSARIDGSTPAVRLNPGLAAGGVVCSPFAYSRDQGTVVYRANVQNTERFDLFAQPVDGSAAATLLTGGLGAGWTVESMIGVGGEERAVFLATRDGETVFDVFSAPLDAAPCRRG